VLVVLERFMRPTSYRLVGVHYSHGDGTGDHYVVLTRDGLREVPIETRGQAVQVLGSCASHA
jgi:hypothetical protein